MNAADIAKLVAQINPMIGIAVSAIQAVRTIRDSVRAANPTDPVAQTLPSDAELIQKLLTDAKLGKQEAQEFRDWLKTIQ